MTAVRSVTLWARAGLEGRMERFAEVVLRHRGAVVLLWLVLLVAGVAAAGGLSDRLSFDFSLPGQPGYEAEQRLVASYGVSSADTLVPVITVPDGQTVQSRRADVTAVFDTVRGKLPALRVVDLASTGNDTFVFDGGRRTFGLVQGAAPTGFGPGTEVALAPVLKQAAAERGLQSGLTSYAMLSAGDGSSGPSVLVETLLGAVGALVVLTFVFASFLALVPLVIAAVSILTTFLLVLGLTELTAVSFVVQFLISLVGLGVAIDYSLLLVSRWREERAHGHDNRCSPCYRLCCAASARAWTGRGSGRRGSPRAAGRRGRAPSCTGGGSRPVPRWWTCCPAPRPWTATAPQWSRPCTPRCARPPA
ncbi:MAG: MMPL family transporter, partial [Pseudonocardiaceae bacterium]